ncbi:hypothetical protein [Szabonella alba]|uniref:Uncharacterized protein n=1 Tax=Szabonella alba TaxID=2804194 RepID=A0A8K0V599_9RHOB|nr:hypothetical protein [Szabonella alba]MBL4915682.1 hypothetical protein [Szabonella alba]
MTGRCSDECLIFWDAVQKAARNRWEQQFASEIAAKAEKPWWRPSAKQLSIMQRMTDELFYGPQHELIEEGDGNRA